MKKYRITAFISALSILILQASAVFAQPVLTLNAMYDPREQTLTVSGESDEFVIVTVTEESVDYNSLYEGQPCEFQYIVPEDGKYTYTFDISDAQSPAKYKVSATTYTQKSDTTFVCYSFDDAQTIFDREMKDKSEDQYIEAFKKNAYAFGIEFDEEISEEMQTEIFRLMYACATQDGLDVYSDYLKSCLYAELNLTSAEVMEDFIFQNAGKLGIDFDKDWKDKVSDNIKDSVISYVTDYDFATLLSQKDKTFSGFLDEVIMTRKAMKSESWLELKNIITNDYSDFFDDILSSNEYSSVNNKDSIYMSLLQYKSQFDTHGKILQKFSDCTDTVLQNEKRASQSPSYGGGGGGGGKISSVNIQSGYTPPETSQAVPSVTPTTDVKAHFEDVDSSHWCFKDIITLYEKGIVNGYGESMFYPDNNVTRAEFVKMLASALEIGSQSYDGFFEDVLHCDWFSPYIASARAVGIIKGDGNNFYPHSPITREDAAVMVSRAVGSLLSSADGGDDFSDKTEMSEYAVDAITALANSGIIKGYEDGSFRPHMEITRAESVRIISSILNLKN